MKTEISVHKKGLARLQEMANISDLFQPSNRPQVMAAEARSLNENQVSVPCCGTPGVLKRLAVYARGLSDALYHCV